MKFPAFIIPGSVSEARAEQDMLRRKLRLEDDFGVFSCITGVDVGYDVARNLAHASLATLSFPSMEVVEQVQCFVPVKFPYVPGLLAFREIPAILAALLALKQPPQLLMVDGHGIAHPRRMGIAAHLGVFTNIPAIGVAKSLLTGKFQMPALAKGAHTPLMAAEEQIGVVLRSRENIAPLYVSPGHRVSMETALALTQQCLTRFRLPEPTRIADKFSKVRQKETA